MAQSLALNGRFENLRISIERYLEDWRLGLGGLIKGFESIEYVFERQAKKHSRETHELGIENRLANFFDSPQFYRCFTHK